MRYEIKATTQFKKSLKRIRRRGLNTAQLQWVINELAANRQLPAKYQDHELKGNHKRHRECHISPDWLLIYYKDEYKLVLTLIDTGTHSDLFKK